MVLLLKMITNLRSRSRGAPAAIKCSRLWNAATNTSWHIKDSKTLFQSGNLPLFFLGTHFPYSQHSRLPRVEKRPICVHCHRRPPQFSMICCSNKRKMTSLFRFFNFNPSRTGEECLEYAPFFPELEKQVNRTGYSALFFRFSRMKAIDSSFLYS